MTIHCLAYSCIALAIPISYVASLYWVEPTMRSNHPATLRKRFRAVGFVCAFSIAASYIALKFEHDDPLGKMGFHVYGSLASVTLPTLLTIIFYTGTLLMCCMDGSWELLFSIREWKRAIKNIHWLRHIVIGPVTEEVAFRGCGATLVAQCYSPWVVCLLYPLFFSICHMHHIYDDIRNGAKFQAALHYRLFQIGYTYLFGVYVTYLFIQTGHILGPVLVHSLCNAIGLPSLSEVSQHPQKYRRFLWTAHVTGFILWVISLPYLLNPLLYTYL